MRQHHVDRAERLLRKLKSELGAVLSDALDDDKVVEVMRNPDGSCWIERLGEPITPCGEMDDLQALALIRTVASYMERTVTDDQPIIEATLPIGGERFHGVIPPVTDSPAFSIRKRASLVFTLDDYVASGILSADRAGVLRLAVEQRKNILVVGGTGSGKTTFVNALIAHMVRATPGHRVLVIEDTAEIQCHAPNHVIKRTTINVDMKALLRSSLRMRPDRIVVGEVRGGEAEALVKAWNTGHSGGAATIHANSAIAGIYKLEEYVEEVVSGNKRPAIAEAVDLVVYIEKTATGRKVREIYRVDGLENGNFKLSLSEDEAHEIRAL